MKNQQQITTNNMALINREKKQNKLLVKHIYFLHIEFTLFEARLVQILKQSIGLECLLRLYVK